MNTNDFEIVDAKIIRGTVDGCEKYCRIGIQAKKYVEEIFGDITLDEENKTLEFTSVQNARDAFNFLQKGERAYGGLICIPDRQKTLYFWNLFVNRLKIFAETMSRGPIGDLIEPQLFDLETEVKYLIKPDDIIRYLLTMSYIDYEVDKINGKI